MVMAEIYALVGENDKALDELEYALSIPAMCTPQLIKADPIFASLINTPRFRKLEDNFDPRASL
jgi:hypothetical protein